MNLEKLDQLIAVKKKSDAPKTQKKMFREELGTLLLEDGFSDQAEKYIWAGFSFSGASAFADYLGKLTKEKRKEAIQKFIKCESFVNNDKGISFKISLHLLARLINQTPDDDYTISTLIKATLSKVALKDGSKPKDLAKSIEKYFMYEITANTLLPQFSDLSITEYITNEFRSLLRNSITGIKASSSVSNKAIELVRNWVTADTFEQENNEQNRGNVPESSVKNTPVIRAEAEEQSGDRVQQNKQASFLINLRTIYGELAKLGNLVQKIQADQLLQDRTIENLKKELLVTKEHENHLMNEQKELRELLHKKEDEAQGLREEINRLNGVIAVYSADKKNEKSEQLNAIASKLKAEYRDFKDAEDMDMTVELGENFRYQIQAIFKILAKAGIDIESR